MAERGEVYKISLQTSEAADPITKYVVVVSRDVVSQRLKPLVVVLTGNWRPRNLPTDVEIEPSADLPLPAEVCWALCHDVIVIPEDRLYEYVGRMPVGKMVEIEQALRYVFDIETKDDVARRET